MSDNDQSSSMLEPSSSASKVISLCGRFLDDHQRVRVEFTLSDVSQKPNVELSLLDQSGIEISHTIILGIIDPQMHITLHLRNHRDENPVWVKALLSTGDIQCLDEKTEQVQ